MNMKTATVAAVLMLTIGCTGPAAQGATKSPVPSTSASSLIPSPSPTPADLPLSKVSFACRLPVVRSTQGGDFASYEGGFVTFPQATFQPDPKGVINSEYLQQDFATMAAPVLHGSPNIGPPYYDLAQNRWVPASAGQASPDGASYAYSTSNPSNPNLPYRIHIVDVAHATDRVFAVDNPIGYIGALVLDFDGSGVYFTNLAAMGLPVGVSRLDLASGYSRQLSAAHGVAMVRGGYAWLDRLDPRDPSPPQTGRSGPVSNSLVRIDLSNGQETIWYYAPGQMVFLAGLDRDGKPIVSVTPGPDFRQAPSLRLVPSPQDSGREIYAAGGMLFSYPQGDTAGQLWLGSNRGIYLYAPAAGLQKVFAYSGNPMFSESMAPIGFCR